MMTSVMLGDYPDVFAGGAIFVGMPFGCNMACFVIPTSFPPQQWGDIVRNADPGLDY